MEDENPEQEADVTTEEAVSSEESAPVSTEAKKPVAVFYDTESLNGRMDRHYNAQLKKRFDGMTEEEIANAIAESRKLKEEAEARRREQLSKEERIQEELQKTNAALQTAEERREEAELKMHITEICAGRGIKNLRYARYHLEEIARSTPEGEQFDEEAALDALLENPQERAALGVDGPPSEERSPVSTSPVQGASPTSAEPRSGGPKDAFEEDAESFRRRLLDLGVGNVA